MKNDELRHYGILGMKWGIRRYQNEDGTLTEAGKARLEKKDAKWLIKKEDKITSKTFNKSKKEIEEYQEKVLNKTYTSVGKNYINAYNKKLSEIMNRNVGEIEAPSGKIVQFVAKRGNVGVYIALADKGYDMDQVKNGVWSGGRIAYKKSKVETV